LKTLTLAIILHFIKKIKRMKKEKEREKNGEKKEAFHQYENA